MVTVGDTEAWTRAGMIVDACGDKTGGFFSHDVYDPFMAARVFLGGLGLSTWN